MGRLRPWVSGWVLEVLTTHLLTGPPEPPRGWSCLKFIVLNNIAVKVRLPLARAAPASTGVHECDLYHWLKDLGKGSWFPKVGIPHEYMAGNGLS